MPKRPIAHRRRRQPRNDRAGLRLGLVASVLGLLLVLLLAAGAVVLRLAAQLPDVGRIEAQFGLRGAEQFSPMLVFDRSGQQLLYRHLNPAAQPHQWLELSDLPDYVLEATVAAVDPEFWTGPGYRALRSLDATDNTISERLVRSGLLPPITNPLIRQLGTALLATELESRYPRERILAWYLNSADYGRAAFGIEAAAQVYLGKSASELALGEAALLAGLTADPAVEPSRQPGRAAQLRESVLQAMPGLSSAEVQRAADQPLAVRSDTAAWKRPDFIGYLLTQLQYRLGRAAAGRSGLRVISTVDQDLLDQSACAAQSHIERLAGAPLSGTVPARGEQPCVAAALLPTLRPSDAGVDHQVEAWSLVILDPQTGELLAAHGNFDQPYPAGPITDPFIYLTAFARGSGPGSMVLDLGSDPEQSNGPVRMRIALANQYAAAADRLLTTVGADAVARTMSRLGLAEPGQPQSLLDVAGAYGAFATHGLLSGSEIPAGLNGSTVPLVPRGEFDGDASPTGASGQGGGEQSIQPSILLEVRAADGALLYEYVPTDQVIISAQLAHLVVDVLSDEPARWPSLGQGNLLEVGFPVGVLSGSSEEAASNWVVGFTPQRVVAVWLGGDPLRQVDRLNGAASIWHALTRFASANLTARGWERPPGMSLVEVCDPSGLLPTSYCPSVVRELFAPGTEPTHFDDLYRPVRINRETGKLATLFTPLESVEERVYFLPPLAAAEWAQAVGVELPPEEYDPLSDVGASWPGVSIRSPEAFEILGNEVAILGEAAPTDFDYFRLQYGHGLNPARWVQIGSDRHSRVTNGRLGTWSTEGLSGLFTLQLLVILDDGQVRTAAIPVTIDNQPPQARLLNPQPGDRFSLAEQSSLTLQAEVLDDVSVQRVEFTVDGRRVGTVFEAPYAFEWGPARSGVFELEVRAYDGAGNRGESQPVVITVLR